MKNTTLCYIEDEGRYLMLHRIKKENDCNKDKWIGVGGKFEDGESPEECLLREVYEETGIRLGEYERRGLVTFVSDEWETEYMFLFTAKLPEELRGTLSDENDMPECDEGVLEWVPLSEIGRLNLWEGDRIFLNMLSAGAKNFSMKLCYKGDKLVEKHIY